MNRLNQFSFSSIFYIVVVLSCFLLTNILIIFPYNASLASVASHALPLHEAVQKKDTTVLQRAIANSKSLDIQDLNGWTALMFATRDGNIDAVSMLLAGGALANIVDRLGQSPLHLAVEVPSAITRLLIQAGGDVDQRNAGGVSTIMLAAGSGREDVVELLLKAGARLDFKDYQGNTVVEWSRRSGNTHLTEMLKQKLALVIENLPEKTGEDFAEDVFVDVTFPDWFKPSYLDLNEDLSDALNSGKQGLMIYVSLSRCSYCKAFVDNTLSLPDVSQRVRNTFDVVGMDIFDDSEMTSPTGRSYIVKDFVTEKKANYSPTMIFYGAKGRELLKIVGYYPPDKFRTVLDYLEGKHYQRETLRSYFNMTKTPSLKQTTGIKLDNKLFSKPPYDLDHRAEPAKRPMLVLFEQPDCSACDRFHKRVLGDKAIRRLMGQFETVHLDASDRTTRLITPTGRRITPRQWFKQLDLTYSPATVFFDETGKEITRLDSETKRWRMEGTLQLILAKDYKNDIQVQRWRRDRAIQFYNLQHSGK